MKNGLLGLGKSSNTLEILKKDFPDMPQISKKEIEAHMNLIGNFLKYKEGQIDINYASNILRKNIEDKEENAESTNNYIDFVHSRIDNDILLGYSIYIDIELTKIYKPLRTYLHKICSEQEKYPKTSIRVLFEYVEEISEYIEEIIEGSKLESMNQKK